MSFDSDTESIDAASMSEEVPEASEIVEKKKKPKSKNPSKVKKTQTKKKAPAKKAATKKSPKKKNAKRAESPDEGDDSGKGNSKDRYEKTPEEIETDSWKLFCGRYSLTFHVCKSCRNDMYHDDDKFEIDGDEYVAKVKMCKKCAVSNLMMNTVHYMGFEADSKKKKKRNYE